MVYASGVRRLAADQGWPAAVIDREQTSATLHRCRARSPPADNPAMLDDARAFDPDASASNPWPGIARTT